MRLAHVAFSVPVPPPAGDSRISVRHLQSDRQDHGASYWPELYLESGYIVAGEARYPVGTVARVMIYREPEPPPSPVDAQGEPILPSCTICGAELSDRQVRAEQVTCGRVCGGAWRAREGRAGNGARKKARAGMGVDAGNGPPGGTSEAASDPNYRTEEHGQ